MDEYTWEGKPVLLVSNFDLKLVLEISIRVFQKERSFLRINSLMEQKKLDKGRKTNENSGKN